MCHWSTTPADLPAGHRERRFAVDDRVLVEELVTGREIDLAVLGRPYGERVVAPALEIVTSGIFDLATKYDGSADFRVPAAARSTPSVRSSRRQRSRCTTPSAAPE